MRKWRLKRVLTPVCVMVAGIGVLAACSSSGSAGSGGSTQSSSASATGGSTTGAPSGSVIKIGVAAAESGAASSLWGEASKIPAVWADYINAQGGIAGHKVEVIVKDSKSDSATGLSVVQDLVQTEHVAAVVTLDTSAETAMANYLQQQRVPLLGINFDQSIVGKPDVFNVTTSVMGFGAGQVIAAKAAGSKTFGQIYCTESPACAQITPAYKAMAQALGIKWAGSVAASASASSYTAQCLALMGQGADVIELDLAPATVVRVATDCRKQGYNHIFSVPASGFSVSAYQNLKGAVFVGALSAFPWWVDDPAAKAYRDAVAKYDPSIKYQASAPAGAWTTLQMFAKALSATTGDVTPAVVSAAYGKVKNETLGGLLAALVTLSADQPNKQPGCFWLYKYSAGDADPTVLHSGSSGNGTSGDLASSCPAG